MTTLRMFTIYHWPSDVPDAEYVVREWTFVEGEPVPALAYQKASSLQAARALVPFEADHCLPRSPEDDPVIVEVWI